MHSTSHDTLVVRLSRMLFQLNQGERLDPQALVQPLQRGTGHLPQQVEVVRDHKDRDAEVIDKVADKLVEFEGAHAGCEHERQVAKLFGLYGVE